MRPIQGSKPSHRSMAAVKSCCGNLPKDAEQSEVYGVDWLGPGPIFEKIEVSDYGPIHETADTGVGTVFPTVTR